MNIWLDDRGYSYMNIFSEAPMEGQVNFSVVNPGVIKAWHRHKYQTDYWMIVMGDAKVGLYDSEKGEGKAIYMGEHNPKVIAIPPGIWHGLTPVGGKPCAILYYVTRKYDPENPDEERAPYDAFPFNWEVEHR